MIVGLTGGIACGKTFCTDYLADRYKIEIIDADLLAREVVKKGSDGLAEIQQVFGYSVITENGELDRTKMRSMMLGSDTVRKHLNAIIHPKVRSLLLMHLEYRDDGYDSPYKVMSVPLLLENNLQRYADVIVVVDVPENIQKKRLNLRDGSDIESIEKIVSSQISRMNRLCNANYIINNSKGKLETERQIDSLHKKLCSLIRL